MRLIDADTLKTEMTKPIPYDKEIADKLWEGWHECTIAVDRLINNVPTIEPMKWIPCSERLPEIGETVLTFDGDCICVERRIEWIDTPEGQLEGEWWIDGYDGDECDPINLRDGTAIAWMPLPKPYERNE